MNAESCLDASLQNTERCPRWIRAHAETELQPYIFPALPLGPVDLLSFMDMFSSEMRHDRLHKGLDRVLASRARELKLGIG